MIMIRNGTLTDDSYSHLKEYMNDIKGENGQHGFLLLETESVDGRSDFDDDKKPEIEVKDLASILQKDELFQEYLDNNRKRCSVGISVTGFICWIYHRLQSCNSTDSAGGNRTAGVSA